MCGWGAGGESGPGAGCGVGRRGGMSGSSEEEGGRRGRIGGPGSVPVAPGGGREAGGAGQQPQIQPGWWPKGSDLGGNQISPCEGDSPEGLELLGRLRGAFISIRPNTPQRSFLCIVRY